MNMQPDGRVIVGVGESLAGLRALRQAVALARRNETAVVAVRAFRCPRSEIGSGYSRVTEWGSTAWPLWQDGQRAWAIHERAAEVAVERAFDDAMGGVPRDVLVQAGQPGPLLVDTAYRDDDVLVVGSSRRRRWWPFRRGIARYCSLRAHCPIVVVPPAQTASDFDGGRLRQWWRRGRAVSRVTAELRLPSHVS